jgi:Ala-tRNA(Pro) deacylase
VICRDLSGLPFWHIFLRDDRKRSYFLVTVPADGSVDLVGLQAHVGSRRLSFVSAADLAAMLGLEPGSVTPFGLLNDTARRVAFVLDSLGRVRLDAHPNVNTDTVQLATEDLCRHLARRGHEARIVDVAGTGTDVAPA